MDSIEFAASEFIYISIFRYYGCLKVREGKAGAQPALLERDREIKSSS
jgi:hypothetical protein